MVSCVEGKETSRVSCVKPLKSTGSNQVSNCVCINDGLYFFLPKSLHIRLPRRTALQSSSSSSSSLWVFSRDVWFSPQVVPHSATGIFCTFFFLTGIHFTPTPLTPLPSPTDKLDWFPMGLRSFYYFWFMLSDSAVCTLLLGNWWKNK